LIELGCSPILVDQSAEHSMASDRGVDRITVVGIVGRRMLVDSLVRAMVIEMADEPVEDGAGVSLVVDQYILSVPISLLIGGRPDRFG
jgi:hypothetical protein